MLNTPKIKNYLEPRAQDINTRRQEGILNWLLFSSLILSFLCTIQLVMDVILLPPEKVVGANPFYLLMIFYVFIEIFLLNRRGFTRLASYYFLLLYFIPITLTALIWGFDASQTILSYGLLIVLAGILVGTRFALCAFLCTSIILIIIAFLQINGLIKQQKNWRMDMGGFDDLLTFIFTFFVLYIVSFLHNREMEKALVEANTARDDLQKERDGLVIRVQEAVEEVKIGYEDRIVQMYRFQEFGRMASGIFHDLNNKLNAISLPVELINMGRGIFADLSEPVKKAVADLNQTCQNTNAFARAAQKQIGGSVMAEDFVVDKEVSDVLSVLGYRARMAKVEIVFERKSGGAMLYNMNRFGFVQVITNLINNAIEACTEKRRRIGQSDFEMKVFVEVRSLPNAVRVSVGDNGIGISPENYEKVFENFYSTKGTMGVGLASVKRLVEKEFNGKIWVEKSKYDGALFIIEMPEKR